MTIPTPVYAVEPQLDVDEFITVLIRSTLGERRPVDDRKRIAEMLRHADLIVTARIDGELVGVARSVTDFSFCLYLSDLAVDQRHQRQGIGRELIRRTHVLAGPQTMLVLLAAPAAETYYPAIGMQQHHSCWFVPRER